MTKHHKPVNKQLSMNPRYIMFSQCVIRRHPLFPPISEIVMSKRWCIIFSDIQRWLDALPDIIRYECDYYQSFLADEKTPFSGATAMYEVAPSRCSSNLPSPYRNTFFSASRFLFCSFLSFLLCGPTFLERRAHISHHASPSCLGHPGEYN